MVMEVYLQRHGNDNKRYHGGWSEIDLIQEVTFKKEESRDEYCGCRFRGHWRFVCDGF